MNKRLPFTYIFLQKSPRLLTGISYKHLLTENKHQIDKHSVKFNPQETPLHDR